MLVKCIYRVTVTVVFVSIPNTTAEERFPYPILCLSLRSLKFHQLFLSFDPECNYERSILGHFYTYVHQVCSIQIHSGRFNKQMGEKESSVWRGQSVGFFISISSQWDCLKATERNKRKEIPSFMKILLLKKEWRMQVIAILYFLIRTDYRLNLRTD